MTAEDQEFTLATLSQFLWQHKAVVAGVALFCAVVAGVLAFTTEPYFRAEVVATDVRDRGNTGLGALASQLGGLATLAGVNLPQGAMANAQQSAAVLESHHLAEEFIKRNNLLPVLLRNSSKPPTLWLAVKKFTENVVTVRKDQRKGITTVDMQWTDPGVTASWANGYVALANELIRTKALEESSRNIAYLNKQLEKTDSVELRRVMYNLIENETKNLMIANGRVEYAFEVVDPAVPPELKAGPHRLINTLVGLILGVGLGGVTAYLLQRVRRSRAGRDSRVAGPSLV